VSLRTLAIDVSTNLDRQLQKWWVLLWELGLGQAAYIDVQDAEATDPAVAAEMKKRRTFRTFSYRGIELEKLLDLSNEDVRYSALNRRDAQLTLCVLYSSSRSSTPVHGDASSAVSSASRWA
jgi:hypothetical protein